MIAVAIKAAKAGGEILEKYFEETTLERELKDDKSFVTKADKESEAAIISIIKQSFPDHGILGEESGEEKADSEYQWIIDPLDGTSNFVNGIPIFAVSIGVIKAGIPVAAVIYNPITNSLYTAEKGKGMNYNGRRTTVSNQGAEKGIVTFGVGSGSQNKAKLNAIFPKVEQFFKSKRYIGSAALELAYVSRGGTEGFVSLGNNKWDYAAGVLLVEEAGGKVTDWEGKTWNFNQNYFLASNGVAHESLIQLVSP